MELTGNLLKEARENQKLSINEVALATKISSRILQAIEKGDVENLPPKTFLRGFVRTYANYLKMDSDRVLESFAEEMGSTLHHPNQPREITQRKAEARTFLRDRGLTSKSIAVVGIALLIFLIIGVKGILDKYEREKLTAPEAESVAGLAEIKNDSVTGGEQKGVLKANGGTKKTVNRAEIKPHEVQQEGKKQNLAAVQKQTELAETSSDVEQVVKPGPHNKPVGNQGAQAVQNLSNENLTEKSVAKERTKEMEKAKSKAKETETPVATQREKEEGATEETVPKKPKPVFNHTVIVEALDQVSVTFNIDRGRVQKIDLKPEQIHTIKAKTIIAVGLSDGGAVNIIHNGKDKGVPGDLGKPMKIRFQ